MSQKDDWAENQRLREQIVRGEVPGSRINPDGTLGIDRAAFDRQFRDEFLLGVILESSISAE